MSVSIVTWQAGVCYYLPQRSYKYFRLPSKIRKSKEHFVALPVIKKTRKQNLGTLLPHPYHPTHHRPPPPSSINQPYQRKHRFDNLASWTLLHPCSYILELPVIHWPWIFKWFPIKCHFYWPRIFFKFS